MYLQTDAPTDTYNCVEGNCSNASRCVTFHNSSKHTTTTGGHCLANLMTFVQFHLSYAFDNDVVGFWNSILVGVVASPACSARQIFSITQPHLQSCMNCSHLHSLSNETQRAIVEIGSHASKTTRATTSTRSTAKLYKCKTVNNECQL